MSDSAIQQQAQQAKQNIQDQANTQRQLINNQASNAINDINNQANQAKSDVDTQVTTQTTLLRGQLSNQELERQKALQKVRQSQVLENRKLNSPLKPQALGTQDQIKSINDVARTNQQAIDIAKSKTEASGESVKADIENQAQASKADIQTQVDKANTDLQSQVDIANSDIDAQIASYQALESQLTPYSIANKDGTISYDISTFLIDNPDKQQTLLDFGYSQDSIDSVKVYNSALKKIEPFKTADNNYDISEYLKNNPDDVKTLLEAGFNQSDIDNTLENNKTLAKLEPFKTSTNNYDISGYLKTNPTDIQALINIGFSKTDIEDSLKTNAIINKLEPFKSVKDKVTYYDLNAYLKANPDDVQSLLDVGFTQADIDSATTGSIPSAIFTKLEPYMTKTIDKDGETVTSINLNAYLKDHLGDIQTLLDAGFNKDDVNQAMKTSSTLAFLDQMAKNGMTTQDALAEYLWATRSVIPNPAIKNAGSGEDTSGYSETVTSFDSGIEALKDVGYSDSTINYLIDYVNHLHSGGRQIQLQSNIDDWNTLNAQKVKEEFAKLSTSEKMIKELGNYNPYDLSEEELMNLKLTLPQTMKDIEPKITYTADNFIPDFTKANPYENMPVGYIDKANLVFKPTIENPLPIYVGQHVDDNHVIDDNGKVITVSEFNKKLPEINAKAEDISNKLLAKDNIKLPDGWMSKSDFNDLSKEEQDIALHVGLKEVQDLRNKINLTTQHVIETQQNALDKLKWYKTSLIDPSTNEEYDVSYDIAAYLRHGGTQQVLLDAGFNLQNIQQAKQYNADTRGIGQPDYVDFSTFRDQYYKDHNWSDTGIDIHNSEASNLFMQHQDEARKAYTAIYTPKVSEMQFIQNYFADNNWKFPDSHKNILNYIDPFITDISSLQITSKQDADRINEARDFYVKKYGNNAKLLSGIGDITQKIFAPSRAIKPEVTLKDISGTEWITGAAQVALFVVTPVVASAVKGLAGTVISKTVQMASGGVFLKDTIDNWQNMTIYEKALSVAMDTLIIGSAMPSTKTVKSLGKYVNEDIKATVKEFKLNPEKGSIGKPVDNVIKAIEARGDILPVELKAKFENALSKVQVEGQKAIITKNYDSYIKNLLKLIHRQ